MYAALVLIANVLMAIASAKSFEIKKEFGTTVFKATALGLKFDGKSNGPYGAVHIDEAVSGELLLDLDLLDTGIGLRNTHMKDNYLETKKFPQGKLTIDSIEGFKLSVPDGKYKFKGRMMLHGVEKPVENAEVIIKKIPTGFEVEAQFDTKISHFSIPVPKYAGLALKDDIQVLVKTIAVEKLK